MFEVAGTLLVRTIDPVHVGAAAGTTPVDLPVARDVRDGDPILTFSAVRGMLRDACDHATEQDALLGAPHRRGTISFTDCRPLLFPVRSAAGGFAWVTSRRALSGFAVALREELPGCLEPQPVEAGTHRPVAIVTMSSWLSIRPPGKPEERVVLAELCCHANPAADGAVAWLAQRLQHIGVEKAEIGGRIAIVDAATFRHLLGTETERRQRVQIDSRLGTVARGALFSLEAVPRDTVFYGSALALSPRVMGMEADGLVSATDVLRRAALRLGAASGFAVNGSATATEAVADARSVGTPRFLTVGGEVTVGMGRCLATLI
jgi:CRISPR-associated protein Cmr4